jgi:hypothetical protein
MFADIIIGGGDDDDLDGASSVARPLPEAQVATLKEVAARYAAGCPFKPGDLVTARPGHNVKGVGHPHVVLDTRSAEPSFNGESGSCLNGRREDIRVATIMRGHVAAFWDESWHYEPYSLPETLAEPAAA